MISLPNLYHGGGSTPTYLSGAGAASAGPGLTPLQGILILLVVLGIIVAIVFYLSNRKKSSVIK